MEQIQAPEFPPNDHADFPEARDRFIRSVEPAIWKLLGFRPHWFQHEVLRPPEPYASTRPLLCGLFGAKRIGKSLVIGDGKIPPYLFVPGTKIRVYAPEHENAEREFSYLNRLIFHGHQGHPPLKKYFPWLQTRLQRRQLNPREGALELLWGDPDSPDHVQVLSRSWERRVQWLGEPIDLAVFAEPGLLPESPWEQYVQPNLVDRRGQGFMAGTVDYPWLYDSVHRCGHDPDISPDIFCCCEIHRRENPITFDAEAYARAQRREDPRILAINWEGKWGVYSNTAYGRLDTTRHVRYIPPEAMEKMKRGLPGWQRFFVLDTGRCMALGEFVINTRGHMFMIEEYCNYEYRGGKIHETEPPVFRPWLSRYFNHLYRGQESPLIYVDPTSPFKSEIAALGLPYQDAVNDHEVGVTAVNEYLGLNALTLSSTCRNTIYELPRVRWAGKDTGIGGRRHLARGNDHCADLPRYACATRPAPANFSRQHEPSIVERDEASILQAQRFRDVDPDMGALY